MLGTVFGPLGTYYGMLGTVSGTPSTRPEILQKRFRAFGTVFVPLGTCLEALRTGPEYIMKCFRPTIMFQEMLQADQLAWKRRSVPRNLSEAFQIEYKKRPEGAVDERSTSGPWVEAFFRGAAERLTTAPSFAPASL